MGLENDRIVDEPTGSELLQEILESEDLIESLMAEGFSEEEAQKIAASPDKEQAFKDALIDRHVAMGQTAENARFVVESLYDDDDGLIEEF